ncbi:tubulin polyglutamylase complex subunit 2 [Lingula anatina]|uniref:Tubulin polyglutamylase complex subunit 2 n=1 Tax=Lingula anatina TaxID=7574 RepID=A0A1S3K4H7_LINAN|nr:tubulin polyglutamylase complex subunit 2 [Lingula anatina]|eukprot:XP_013417427.1 tubulin polyglutamylase complex subunit 2 [Lingula anatina]
MPEEDTRYKRLFEQLTLGVLKTLDKRPGITGVVFDQKPPAETTELIGWDQRCSCFLPDDLKCFYLTNNGMKLTWKTKVGDTLIPLGKMEINPISSLNRFGGIVGNSSPAMPSLADLEAESEEEDDPIHPKPHFDQRARIFELDSCDGHGKVCLVYKCAKPGVPTHNPEVWFMDRSLQWHFLAESFTSYYRLMLTHLGLPQWQYAFTDMGLPPQAKQWFNVFAPERLQLDSNFVTQPAPSDSQESQVIQLDVGKVFRGKSDKKKPAPTASQAGAAKQGAPQRKGAVSSAKSQPSSSSRGASLISQALSKSASQR